MRCWAAAEVRCFTGVRHGLSYEELKERFSHVPQTWLEQLLAVLSNVRQKSSDSSSQGLTSLLDAGMQAPSP